MKFLQIPQFEEITVALSSLENEECRLQIRLDPYSCKLTNQDKSAYHALNKSYEALAKSPTAVVSPSALGPLSESASRKKLITLVTALNNSFPSNDFCGLQGDQFVSEPVALAISTVDSHLAATFAAAYSKQLQQRVWNTVTAEFDLPECSVFAFTPEPDYNPFENQHLELWALHYFFYNQKLRRVLLFSCRALRRTSADAMEEDYDTWGSEDDFEMEDV